MDGRASDFTDDALGRFSACDNGRGGLHAAFTHNTQRLIGVASHRNGSLGFTAVVPSFLPGNVVVTHAHPGIACENFSGMRIFFSRDVDGFHQSISFVESSDGGFRWSAPAPADELMTDVHGGVDATFDPASGQYLYAYRGERSRLVTKVMSPESRVIGYPRSDDESFCVLEEGGFATGAAPGLSFGTTDCWRASDTPSIACGSPEALGEYNCLLAWAGVDWLRQMKYAPAKVVAGSSGGHRLELQSIRTSGHTVYGSPSVAFDRSQESPWRVALHAGGKTAHTLRKAADPEATWEHTGLMVFRGKIVSPVLGSGVPDEQVFSPFFLAPAFFPSSVSFGVPLTVGLTVSD